MLDSITDLYRDHKKLFLVALGLLVVVGVVLFFKARASSSSSLLGSTTAQQGIGATNVASPTGNGYGPAWDSVFGGNDAKGAQAGNVINNYYNTTGKTAPKLSPISPVTALFHPTNGVGQAKSLPAGGPIQGDTGLVMPDVLTLSANAKNGVVGSDSFIASGMSEKA